MINKCKLASVKSLKADVSIVSPPSEWWSDRGLMLKTSAFKLLTVANLNNVCLWLTAEAGTEQSLHQLVLWFDFSAGFWELPHRAGHLWKKTCKEKSMEPQQSMSY